MEKRYYIIKLGDTTSDIYIINDVDNFEVLNRYRNYIIYSSSDAMQAYLELTLLTN